MAKKGPLSVEEKRNILEQMSQGDLDIDVLSKDMDRTVKILSDYIKEAESLGYLQTRSVAPEDEVSSTDEESMSEMDKIRREHLRQIIPSHKGATVFTPAASQYVDEENKNRSQKPKYGKYSGNVMKIRKDE